MTKNLNETISNTGLARSTGNIGGRLERHLLEGTLQALPQQIHKENKKNKISVWSGGGVIFSSSRNEWTMERVGG